MGFPDLAWTPSLRRPEKVGGDLGRDRTGVMLTSKRTVPFSSVTALNTERGRFTAVTAMIGERIRSFSHLGS